MKSSGRDDHRWQKRKTEVEPWGILSSNIRAESLCEEQRMLARRPWWELRAQPSESGVHRQLLVSCLSSRRASVDRRRSRPV
jgi:hypothetical protein